MQEDFQTKEDNKPVYEPVNITDPRLSLISNSIRFPVVKGADQITAYKASASSASTSGISFNVILPSVRTAVAPVAYLKCKITFTVTATAGNAGDKTLAYALTSAFGDYPLNSMFDIVNATFNNSSITFEQGQNWDLLKHLIPKRLTEYWQTLTPTQQDVFMNYNDATGTNFDPIIGFGNAEKQYNRGGWFEPSFNITTNPNPQNPTASDAVFTVTFCEPVVCPPFCMTSSEGYSDGAFDGLTTMRLNFTFKPVNSMRVIRSKLADMVVKSFNIASNTDAELQLFYLTPHPSTIIPTRNVRPFLNVIRNVTPYAQQTFTAPNAGAVTTRKYHINSIQLGVMPSKVLIGVREVLSAQRPTDANVWVPISNASLTLNNRSALLSTSSQEQLFEMSKEAGLQHPSDYAVWRGAIAKSGTNQTPLNYKGAVGGILALDVGKHLAVDDQYASGSVGQFNFFGDIEVSWAVQMYGGQATDIEVVVLFLNEGLLINELGASSIINGCLDKETVLKVSQEKPMKNRKNPSLVGGTKNWFQKELKKSVKQEKEGGVGYASGKASGRSSRYDKLTSKLI